MNYVSGKAVEIGDTVDLGGNQRAKVVGIIAEGQYADGYDRSDWEYLISGLILSTDFGDLRLEQPDEDLELVARLTPKTHSIRQKR